MKSLFVAMVVAVCGLVFSPVPTRADEADSSQLRQQIENLRRENQSLKQQVSRLQAKLDEAAGAAAPAPATPGQPAASAKQRTPTPAIASASPSELPPWEFGVRSGWGGSPWRGGTGGFFYGAYVDRQISDSMLGGNVNLEFMFGSLFGANAAESNTGTGRGGVPHGNQVPWQNSYLFQPTLQYYPHFRSLLDWWPRSLWPYLLAGPEAVLGRFGQPGKGIATDAEAGGVAGAGVKLLPFWEGEAESTGFLQRLAWGAEWRFNQGTNGQSFNQYMATLSFGF